MKHSTTPPVPIASIDRVTDELEEFRRKKS
jgi:hypothetical protein